MNFYSVIIFSYFIVAFLLLYFINRDRKNKEVFFGRHAKIAWTTIIILILGMILAVYARFIEPKIMRINNVSIKIENIQNLKIAFIADIQLGSYKKTEWAEKIVDNLKQIKPDLIILGGDLIDNEGTFEDESVYLEPFGELARQYPIYYIMGNHEYGIGNEARDNKRYETGDRSELVISRMQKLGIPLLKNDLACPTIKDQKICLYGIDDIWSRPVSFDKLKEWDQKIPLIFLTHNPDGILLWPKDMKKPDLVLAGHTHGGQVWLPFIGPLGDAGVVLGKKYYRGLNYWGGIPIFTTVGIGESGGEVRFLTWPEIAVINIKS